MIGWRKGVKPMLRRKLATVTLIVIAAAVGVGVWLSPPKVAERDTEVEMPAAPTTPANWSKVLEAMGALEKKLHDLRSLPATSE